MAFGTILGQTFDGYTKEETINDAVRDLYGVDDNATPADLFLIARLGNDNYAFYITVYYPDGITPWPNLALEGVEDIHGEQAITNKQGRVLALASNFSPTITATSQYIDIQNISQQISKDSNYLTEVSIIAKTVDYISYESNTTVNKSSFSPTVKSIDIVAVGGGQGGYSGNGNSNTGGGSGGKGGNAGQITQTNNILIENFESFKINIGTGGAGSIVDNPQYPGDNPGNGGNTTVVFTPSTVSTVTARGGRSNATYNGGSGGKGAIIDRNSTPASQGQITTFGYLFDNESFGYPGGGGGGGAGGSGVNYSSQIGATGGAPGGGDGGYTGIGGNGSNGGGGGGGGFTVQRSGAYYVPANYNGGSGGPGIVYIRFHYE